MGGLKEIEKGHRVSEHEEGSGIGDRLKRGIIDKVQEASAKAKIDEAVIRPDQHK